MDIINKEQVKNLNSNLKLGYFRYPINVQFLYMWGFLKYEKKNYCLDLLKVRIFFKKGRTEFCFLGPSETKEQRG